MKAMIQDRYGPPDILHMAEVPDPVPAAGEVLVRVHASSATTADWRLRASAFPNGLWLVGRLVSGIFRPRHRIPGVEFAGEVAALGPGVTRFRPGDRVFGFSGHGANAEYLTIRADAAIAMVPAGLDYGAAAALPFGATSALVFLRDFARVRPGMDVLVVGASGGVGSYGVQIARAMGARVTGVASSANEAMVRALGAEAFVDYARTDVARSGMRFDVVFDTVGALDYAAARQVLRPDGVFVPLNFGWREALTLLAVKLGRRPRMAFGVSGDSAATLADLSAMVAAGDLLPVIDRRFPLTALAEAHAFVEKRHRRGAVIVDVIPPRTQVSAVRTAGRSG